MSDRLSGPVPDEKGTSNRIFYYTVGLLTNESPPSSVYVEFRLQPSQVRSTFSPSMTEAHQINV